MLTRILTALIGIVVFFAVLALPQQVFTLIVFAVTAVMLGEMYGVLKCGRLVDAVGFLSGAAVFVPMLLSGKGFGLALAVVIMLYLFTIVFLHGKRNCKDVLAHGFVTLFLTFFMSYIVRIRLEFPTWAVLWVFIIAWFTDSGAYFAGVFLGKHKLVPHISPKKTVEGAVGGVVLCVIASAVYAYILNVYAAGEKEIAVDLFVAFMLMGLVGSVLSQFGDLVASCIKRDYEIKDYGSILPGHGGLMDRFDSVVFIAPFVYYAIRLIVM
ncbi:MAG: phosphatidate cytidylyltransferase [Clostridia bacterium]|nr:phosphatidate cytidylyltransferase [Clostridia bacterium]